MGVKDILAENNASMRDYANNSRNIIDSHISASLKFHKHTNRENKEHKMENTADLFRDELNPGERIIWTGRPYQGFMLRPADALFIPFSLMWGGFAIFWESSVVRGGGPFFFILWGVPFVLVGLYIIAGRFFVDILQRRKTYYALTDERVMIISGLFQKNTKSIYLKNLSEVNVSTSGDGRGTITFGQSSPMMWLYGASGLPTTGRYQMPPSFERIEDVKQVHQQLRLLQRGRD